MCKMYTKTKEPPRAFNDNTLRGRRRSRELEAICKIHTQKRGACRREHSINKYNEGAHAFREALGDLQDL